MREQGAGSRELQVQRSRGENQFNIQNPHTPHPTPYLLPTSH
ncbi:hypothetical protein [Scytonema millei]|nr:hypothetical protein [Scytonema millei]